MTPESVDGKQMREALKAIRRKLVRMRLESEEQMTRLSETRRAADNSAAARRDAH